MTTFLIIFCTVYILLDILSGTFIPLKTLNLEDRVFLLESENRKLELRLNKLEEKLDG